VRRLLNLAFDALLALILPIPAQPVPPRRIPPRRPGMEPGSNVIVLDDPLAWGIGQVESVGVDGKVRVEFKHSIKGTLIESFNAFDLELLERFEAMDTLTDRDFRQLRQRDTRKS
jgi:hypothetical protein